MSSADLLLCLIVAIADGDTLTARCEADAPENAQTLKIRLAEIDAPEKGQPYGTRSRNHLARLCFRKQAVILPRSHDRFGRTVARVGCSGVDASTEQVRAGMAWAFARYLRDANIATAETEARASGRGLWADPHPMAPWDWRARKQQKSTPP